MNTPSNAIPESNAFSQAPAATDISPMQRMYWSIRRELWEYRSIYLAPLIGAALILVSSLIRTIHLPAKLQAASALDPIRRQEAIQEPYIFAALLLMGITLVVAIFYCLDALQSERRDRSILFWKSLPVSDLTTVLSKASIPIVVLPLVTFAVTAVTQAIMLLLSSARLAGSGNVAMLWSQVSLFQMWMVLFFHLLALHGFWYAPFYGWLLLASAWARRAALLWATLPLLAIGVLEKIAFSTSYFAGMVGHHFMGGPGSSSSAADRMSMGLLMPMTPAQFLTSPGLWIGLALTAAFLAAAVWLRQHREPS
jgi:ABC-2 type transport system permease protein